MSALLLSIGDELNGFHKTSWVTTSYRITYTGSLLFDSESVQRLMQTFRLPIIITKLSDILGRRPAMLSSIIMVLIFSAGCGGIITLTLLSVISTYFQHVHTINRDQASCYVHSRASEPVASTPYPLLWPLEWCY